jgi:RNA polymerase sigma factor (sigma-70 family)
MKYKKVESVSTEAVVLAFKQNRNSEMWGEIYRRYYERVVRFCLKMGLKREDALDMGQEVMLKVYRQIHTLERLSSFESWMFRMTRNACINYLKHQKRYSTTPLDSRFADQPVETSTALLDKELAIQEQYQRMTAIVASQPPEIRQLIQMKYLENYPVKELGRIFT